MLTHVLFQCPQGSDLLVTRKFILLITLELGSLISTVVSRASRRARRQKERGKKKKESEKSSLNSWIPERVWKKLMTE